MSVKVKTAECDNCERTIMPNEQVYGNGGTYCADCLLFSGEQQHCNDSQSE